MSSILQSVPFSETNETIDIGDIIHAIRRRWRLIAITSAIGFFAAAIWVFASHPQFSSTGAIYMGDVDSGVPQANNSEIDFLSDFKFSSDINTQVELLKSQALVEQAILETGFNATIAAEGKHPLSYLQWRLQYGKQIEAFAPNPGDVMAQFATISDPGSTGGIYKIKFGENGAYSLYAPGEWFSGPKLLLTGNLDQPASGGGLSLVVKPEIPGSLPKPGSSYVLKVVPAKGLAAKLLDSGLNVTAGGTITSPTKLTTVDLLWGNPYKGKVFVNQLMQDFIASQLTWKTESASNTEAFVGSQLQNIRDEMTSANQALANYQAQTSILDVPAASQSIINELSQLQVDRTKLLLKQEALKQMEVATTDPSANSNPYLISQVDDPAFAQLSNSLANAEAQLQAQRVSFTADAPEAQVQAATVGNLKAAIRSLILNDERNAADNLANIDSVIKQYQEKLKVMPAQSLRVIDLKRSSDMLGQLYVLLMQKQEEAQVAKAATIVDSRVVSPAEVPLTATKPQLFVSLGAGLLFGLLGGVAFVLVHRAFSRNFQTYDEVRRIVPIKILGLIPSRIKSEGTNVFSSNSNSVFCESFRLLRSNLYLSYPTNSPRVILLTSSATGEGKTTIACNLARMLSDDGKRVVLVDADLHQGNLFEAVGVSQAPGLTEWLNLKERSPVQFVKKYGFSVLTSGRYPDKPSELLNSPNMQKILEDLKSEYDYVIIDCPPLPIVSDTLSLIKYADSTISIVFLERTRRSSFTMHCAMIAALGARHNIVINGAEFGEERYSYGSIGNGNTAAKRPRLLN